MNCTRGYSCFLKTTTWNTTVSIFWSSIDFCFIYCALEVSLPWPWPFYEICWPYKGHKVIIISPHGPLNEGGLLSNNHNLGENGGWKDKRKTENDAIGVDDERGFSSKLKERTKQRDEWWHWPYEPPAFGGREPKKKQKNHLHSCLLLWMAVICNLCSLCNFITYNRLNSPKCCLVPDLFNRLCRAISVCSWDMSFLKDFISLFQLL